MTREEFVKVCTQNSYKFEAEYDGYTTYCSEDGRASLSLDDCNWVIVHVDDTWYSSLGWFRSQTWEGVNKFLTLCDYQPLVNLKV